MIFLKSESRHLCTLCSHYETCNILPKLKRAEVHTSAYDTEIDVRRCELFSKVTFGQAEWISIGLTSMNLTGTVLSIFLVSYLKRVLTDFPIMMTTAIISLIAMLSGLTAMGRAFFFLRKSRYLKIRKLAKTLMVLNVILILFLGIILYFGGFLELMPIQ